jgi:2-polyprenyl-6-methoxyphenol hydroxylase-like FAD-dependent oxidoreductase
MTLITVRSAASRWSSLQTTSIKPAEVNANYFALVAGGWRPDVTGGCAVGRFVHKTLCIANGSTDRFVPVSGRAIVVGAGIAGLAAAHALEDLGYRVRVLEREAGLRAEGAGISLWPNAVRALCSLGLGDVLDQCGYTLKDAITLAPNGDVLATMPLRRIEKRFGPLVSADRGELLAALRTSFDGEIEYGVDVQAQNGRLWVNESPIEADLIVGADGIGSTTRKLVTGDVVVRPAGYGAWRGIAVTGPLTPAAASETMGRGKRFGLIPLTNGRTYWFAVTTSGQKADLVREFSGWHEPITAVLEATPPSNRSFLLLADVPRLLRWHHNEIVLIGDAAHAMTPNLGQGAAQALQDVAVLAQWLRREPLAVALAGYEKERKRRCERIIARSRAVGRLAQASHPLVAKLRDASARLTPDAALMYQFAGILKESKSEASQTIV